MLDIDSLLKIEDNAVVLNGKYVYESDAKWVEISSVLNNLMPNWKTKSIIVDMEGVRTFNLNNSSIIFWNRVGEAHKKNISIKVTNVNEDHGRKINQFFNSIVEITEKSTENLLKNLKSESE